MPLNEPLKKQVIELAWLNTQESRDKVFTLLKEALRAGTASPQDILEFTSAYWENPHRFVLDASIINLLGVFLESLVNPEHKKLVGDFYQIAADRNNSWGCHNYAQCLYWGHMPHGVEKKPDLAWQYIQKAIALTSKTFPHQHKLLLAKFLYEAKGIDEASITLAEFLNFHLNLYGQQFQINEASQGLNFLEDILKNILNELINSTNGISTELAAVKLRQLDFFLEKKFKYSANQTITNKISLIHQQVAVLRGICLQVLNRKSEAWLTYCCIFDKIQPFYQIAVKGRANLLKQTITEMLLSSEPAATADVTTTVTAQLGATHLAEISRSSSLIADAIITQTSLSKHWQKGNVSFDFLIHSKQDAEFNESITNIETLIKAKNIELELIKKKLTLLSISNLSPETAEIIQLKHKITELIADEKALHEAKTKINADYEKYKASQRQIYRRGQAEKRFFDPSRQRNKENIIALAHQIIDERFNLTESHNPIDLTGISVRRLAAAEKAFQNAVLHLSGPNCLQIGIPIMRSEPWYLEYASGYNHYGPKEAYKVGQTSIIFEHRADPKSERLGDSYSPEHKAYDNDFYLFLVELTQGISAKESQIASLLIKYGKQQKPILLTELQSIYAAANESTCERFNKMCAMIMAKEQVQWLSATDPTYCGFAVLHARCLLLIEKGYLTIAEVFRNDGVFSIYANTKILRQTEKVQKACERVEALYLEYLKAQHASDYSRMFRTTLSTKEAATMVSTREQAHADLKVAYGGVDDSDGEGYKSDLELESFSP